MHGVGDNHRASLCGRLDARGDIGRVAEYLGVFARAGANHYGTRINADARGELQTRGMFVRLRDRVDRREARARGTFGVVVMRFGIAEVSHHAIAKVLGDVPPKRSIAGAAARWYSPTISRPLFRIEMAGDLRRADEITEKYRQMPAPPVRGSCKRIGAAAPSGAAHCPQNMASGAFSGAHLAQRLERRRTLVAKSRPLDIVGSAL
jgi:hypothetical protein